MYSCTIFLPCFNNEKTLLETLESVIIQNAKHIYLVNDGSEDRTHEICESYALKYPKVISYINSKTNRGVAFHFHNFCNALSTDYWSWIGADDIWSNGFLTSQINCLERNPSAIAVFSNYTCINSEGNPAPMTSLFDHEFLKSSNQNDIFTRLIKENFLCAPSSLCRSHKTPTIPLAGVLNDKNQDQETWLSLILEGNFLYNDQTFVKYRISSESLSQLSKFPLLGKLNLFTTLSASLHSAEFIHYFKKHQLDHAFLKQIDESLLKAAAFSPPVHLLRVQYLENLYKYCLDNEKQSHTILRQLSISSAAIGLHQKSTQLFSEIAPVYSGNPNTIATTLFDPNKTIGSEYGSFVFIPKHYLKLIKGVLSNPLLNFLTKALHSAYKRIKRRGNSNLKV
jgi:glycosyltransferase involved in cell wall biosynthesis